MNQIINYRIFFEIDGTSYDISDKVDIPSTVSASIDETTRYVQLSDISMTANNSTNYFYSEDDNTGIFNKYSDIYCYLEIKDNNNHTTRLFKGKVDIGSVSIIDDDIVTFNVISILKSIEEKQYSSFIDPDTKYFDKGGRLHRYITHVLDETDTNHRGLAVENTKRGAGYDNIIASYIIRDINDEDGESTEIMDVAYASNFYGTTENTVFFISINRTLYIGIYFHENREILYTEYRTYDGKLDRFIYHGDLTNTYNIRVNQSTSTSLRIQALVPIMGADIEGESGDNYNPFADLHESVGFIKAVNALDITFNLAERTYKVNDDYDMDVRINSTSHDNTNDNDINTSTGGGLYTLGRMMTVSKWTSITDFEMQTMAFTKDFSRVGAVHLAVDSTNSYTIGTTSSLYETSGGLGWVGDLNAFSISQCITISEQYCLLGRYEIDSIANAGSLPQTASEMYSSISAIHEGRYMQSEADGSYYLYVTYSYTKWTENFPEKGVPLNITSYVQVPVSSDNDWTEKYIVSAWFPNKNSNDHNYGNKLYSVRHQYTGTEHLINITDLGYNIISDSPMYFKRANWHSQNTFIWSGPSLQGFTYYLSGANAYSLQRDTVFSLSYGNREQGHLYMYLGDPDNGGFSENDLIRIAYNDVDPQILKYQGCTTTVDKKHGYLNFVSSQDLSVFTTPMDKRPDELFLSDLFKIVGQNTKHYITYDYIKDEVVFKKLDDIDTDSDLYNLDNNVISKKRKVSGNLIKTFNAKDDLFDISIGSIDNSAIKITYDSILANLSNYYMLGEKRNNSLVANESIYLTLDGIYTTFKTNETELTQLPILEAFNYKDKTYIITGIKYNLKNASTELKLNRIPEDYHIEYFNSNATWSNYTALSSYATIYGDGFFDNSVLPYKVGFINSHPTLDKGATYTISLSATSRLIGGTICREGDGYIQISTDNTNFTTFKSSFNTASFTPTDTYYLKVLAGPGARFKTLSLIFEEV